MAKDGKTHIIRAKTLTEAVSKAKSRFGSDFQIVTRRDVREEGGLFKRITGGKPEIPEVELEVAPADPAAKEEPKPTAQPGGVSPHLLAKTYAKALEGVEKHSAAAKRAMGTAALPFVEIGETATGIAGRLDEFQRALERSDQENARLRADLLQMFSLQARNGLPAVGTELLDSYRRLVASDMNDALAREMVEKIQRENPGIGGGERITSLLRTEMARRIPAAGPILLGGGGPTVVALIGPTGMGKSTAIAKLAIEYVHMGRSIGLINEDLRRPGAAGQMINLSTLITAPMTSANDPREIADAVRSMAGKDLILIDTAGRSPRDAKGIEKLGQLLRAAGAREIHLTLSSVNSGKALREFTERYKPAGFNRLLLTKLDESLSRGNILDLAAGLSDGLSYVTDSPDYMKPIRPAENQWLADLALGLVEIEAEAG